MSNPMEQFFAGQRARAKLPGDYLPTLEPGQHEVAITRFGVRPREKGNGYVFELDVVVLKSTTVPPGTARGWAWWPGDEHGYNEGRFFAFVGKAGECIGDKRAPEAIAADMVQGNGRGIRLRVTIVQPHNKQGQPMTSQKSGKPVLNATWDAIPQTLQDVQAMRQQLDQMQPVAPVAAPAQQAQAPAPVAPPAPMGQPVYGSPTTQTFQAPPQGWGPPAGAPPAAPMQYAPAPQGFPPGVPMQPAPAQAPQPTAPAWPPPGWPQQ